MNQNYFNYFKGKNSVRNAKSSLRKWNKLRRLSWRKGVSDLIGTLIVLTITVILFTGLITFVINLPGPLEEERANFKTYFELKDGGNAEVAVVHIGGERLRTADIRIFVYVNNQIAHQSSATVKIQTEYWTIGQKWNETISGVTISSTVILSIVDYVKNVVVFSKYLLGSSANTAPVILRIGTFPEPVLINTDFKVYAIVWDPENNLDKNSVYVNMSDVDASFASVNNGIYKLNYVGGNRFERSFGKMPEITLPDNQGVVKNVTVNATDVGGLENIPGTGNGTITIGRLSKIPDKPDLLIRQDPDYQPLDVRFSKSAPLQGDFIMIYVRVTNVGGTATNVSVEVYDNGVFIGDATDRFGATEQRINGNYDMREFQLLWQVSSAGMHRIMANASVVSNYPWEQDDNLGNNNASADLGAMPRILLVDDDNYPSDNSYKDTAGYIEAALEACGFQYDVYRVRQGQDGPKYSVGTPKLEDYGVVIWTTGYESANTLRANDIASLSSYLDSNNRGLWLIGQDILNDVSTNVSGGSQFILNKLHITGIDYDVGLPGIINGSENHFLTSMMNFSTANPAGILDKADKIALDSDLGSKKMLEGYGTGDCFGMTYNNTGSTRRLCFIPFEFSRIKSTDDITILTFKIVLWLGNLTRSFGVDLAVTSQEIDNTEPYYFETVKVSFTIRNNSDINLTNVHYSIYLDYGTSDAMILYDSIGNKMCDMLPIPRMLEKGGSANASFKGEVGWVADRLGLHTITLFVDPSNELDEINEDNNIATPPFAVTRVFVRYNVLVVDDDGSENNGGSGLNSTENVTDSLDFLNYKYDFVVSGADINSTYMQQYNLVVWSSGRVSDSLSKEEMENLTDYLTLHSGNVWLIGDGIIDSLAPGGVLSDDAKDVFKLTSVVLNTNLPGALYGHPDNFAHGANYRMKTTTPISDVDAVSIDETDGAFPILADASNRAFMYAYKNESDYPYNFVLSAFDIGLVDNEENMHELVYLVMHYFKVPDERIELRVTAIDLYYATQSTTPTPLYQMKPVLGNSYMLQATIWNIGGNRGDAVVRFVDGLNVINSGVVSVREDGSTIIEVIWTPTFAGSRTISAIIDPVNNIPVSYDPADTSGEIMKFNNIASISLEVYYFYDDMEHGTLNWRHDTTLMNINGESPIEFIDAVGLVKTNVVSDWAEMHGWDKATRAYHSYNSSYLMYEGWGGGPVDVVIILDRSGSMGSGNYPSKLWDAKMAALAMVANLSDESRVAVCTWVGVGQGSIEITDFIKLDPAGRDAINNTIGGIGPKQVTMLWDTIGVAVTHCIDEPNPEGRARAVVVLSDGCDRNGNDDEPFEWPLSNGVINTLEQASQDYCPWHNWTELKSYSKHFGKYNGYEQDYGSWHTVSPKQGNRRGLLYAPIPIFTIGLGVEHHFPPYYPSTTTKPTENQIETTYATYIHSDPSVDTYWESGTVEYNLWRIATTTGGRYFYAEESKDLGAIFDTIGRIISGGMQARGSRDAPVHTNSSRASTTLQLGNGATGKDAFIDQTNSNTNYGSATSLYVRSYKDNNNSRTLVEIDITGLPAGAVITSASLQLYKYAGSTNSRTYDVYRITADWQENLVKWSNQPAIAGTATSSTSVGNNNAWYSWDVTADVQAFVAATYTNYGWLIRDNGENNNNLRHSYFYSKESSSANKPKLVIDYNLPTPTVSETEPTNTSTGVSVYTDIVIDFNMEMNTSVQPTISIIPGITYSGSWIDSDTYTITHASPLSYSTKYYVNISGAKSAIGTNQVGVYSIYFTTGAQPTNPHVVFTQPENGEMDVSVNTNIIIVFNENMNSVTQNAILIEPAITYNVAWGDPRTLILTPVPKLSGFTIYTVTVRANLAISQAGGNMLADYVFQFETGSSSGRVPGDRWLITESFNLSGYESARLSFFQRYNLRIGTNGGVIQVGEYIQNQWKWRYIYPLVPYTGNVKWNVTPSRIFDSYNTPMQWCYNGISSAGTYDWEYVEVDLTPFITSPSANNLRIKFLFLNIAGGAGGSWVIDDVKIKATRAPTTPTYNSKDQWELSTNKAHSGSYAWWCHNTSVGGVTDAFSAGIDTSLYTKPIDLTNALNATLSAYMAFNFNYVAGRPPDSLRVEVSSDNGKSWTSLTLGVRACWNVSGADLDIYDGVIDGKSYSGISDGSGWVPAGTLTRLNCDLTGWAGNVIILRFRIVTATDHLNYQPSHNWGTQTPYYGFYLDDVIVSGTSAG